MAAVQDVWRDEALGVVVVVGRSGSPAAVAWSGDWAAGIGQPLTVVPAGRWDAGRLAGWAGPRASSIVMDAVVAARVSAAGFGVAYPTCPVLVLPPRLARPASDAPVVLVVRACEGCAVPMGFAFAHAQRVGAPLHVTASLGGSDAAGAARLHALAEMFACCYPDLDVTLDAGRGEPLASLAARARMVVAGVVRPERVRPRRPEVLALARGPVALVPMAA